MKHLIIQMSRGHGIPIDKEEVPLVLKGIESRTPVVVKQGIFNPAFFVSIIEDVDRTNGWNRDYGNDKYVPTSESELPDMFHSVREEMLKVGSQKNIKQLHEGS